MRFPKKLILALTAMVASMGLVGLGFNAIAQDSDADPDTDQDLFAAIYQGSCDDLESEVVYQLGTVTSTQDVSPEVQASPVASPEILGFQDVEAILMVDINLEVGIDSLFQQGQTLSLVIRDANAENDSAIVCGELGGVMVNSQIAVALTGDDTSDYYGIAIFDGTEDESTEIDSLTPVRVYVFEDSMLEDGTPVAGTPMAVSTSAPANNSFVDAPESIEEPVPPPPAPSSPEPTVEPTAEPTVGPTMEPTSEPTAEPTAEPTSMPTAAPTAAPTTAPTIEPTSAPTSAPTAEATQE